MIAYRKSNEGYITAFRFLSHISVHGGHVCSRMSFRAIAVSLPEVFHAGIGYFSALGAWRTTAPLAFSRPHERMIHLRGRCLTLFPRRLLDEMINPCSMSRQDILREPANPACVSWPWRLFSAVQNVPSGVHQGCVVPANGRVFPANCCAAAADNGDRVNHCPSGFPDADFMNL